ncbi:MAG: hypothetical protein IJ158_00350 [Treponema sp.]|nr:hypothetical protein [Treponema sp.]
MKKTLIALSALLLLGTASCSNQKSEDFEAKIEAEKTEFQNNIENVLDEFGMKGMYSVIVIFQESGGLSPYAIAEQNITKKVYGKAKFDGLDYNLQELDGLYECRNYTANNESSKESKVKVQNDSRSGYFSAIITIENIEKEKKDKLLAIMNYSVSNTNRGDVINVVSKSDFQ